MYHHVYHYQHPHHRHHRTPSWSVTYHTTTRPGEATQPTIGHYMMLKSALMMNPPLLRIPHPNVPYFSRVGMTQPSLPPRRSAPSHRELRCRCWVAPAPPWFMVLLGAVMPNAPWLYSTQLGVSPTFQINFTTPKTFKTFKTLKIFKCFKTFKSPAGPLKVIIE